MHHKSVKQDMSTCQEKPQTPSHRTEDSISNDWSNSQQSRLDWPKHIDWFSAIAEKNKVKWQVCAVNKASGLTLCFQDHVIVPHWRGETSMGTLLPGQDSRTPPSLIHCKLFVRHVKTRAMQTCVHTITPPAGLPRPLMKLMTLALLHLAGTSMVQTATRWDTDTVGKVGSKC